MTKKQGEEKKFKKKFSPLRQFLRLATLTYEIGEAGKKKGTRKLIVL